MRFFIQLMLAVLTIVVFNVRGFAAERMVVVILDRSASMQTQVSTNKSRLDESLDRIFNEIQVSYASKNSSQFWVIPFSSGAIPVPELFDASGSMATQTDLSRRFAEWRKSVQPDGLTDLVTALETASDCITKNRTPDCKRIEVWIMTDGLHNWSSKKKNDDERRLSENSDEAKKEFTDAVEKFFGTQTIFQPDGAGKSRIGAFRYFVYNKAIEKVLEDAVNRHGGAITDLRTGPQVRNVQLDQIRLSRSADGKGLLASGVVKFIVDDDVQNLSVDIAVGKYASENAAVFPSGGKTITATELTKRLILDPQSGLRTGQAAFKDVPLYPPDSIVQGQDMDVAYVFKRAETSKSGQAVTGPEKISWQPVRLQRDTTLVLEYPKPVATERTTGRLDTSFVGIVPNTQYSEKIQLSWTVENAATSIVLEAKSQEGLEVEAMVTGASSKPLPLNTPIKLTEFAAQKGDLEGTIKLTLVARSLVKDPKNFVLKIKHDVYRGTEYDVVCKVTTSLPSVSILGSESINQAVKAEGEKVLVPLATLLPNDGVKDAKLKVSLIDASNDIELLIDSALVPTGAGQATLNAGSITRIFARMDAQRMPQALKLNITPTSSNQGAVAFRPDYSRTFDATGTLKTTIRFQLPLWIQPINLASDKSIRIRKGSSQTVALSISGSGQWANTHLTYPSDFSVGQDVALVKITSPTANWRLDSAGKLTTSLVITGLNSGATSRLKWPVSVNDTNGSDSQLVLPMIEVFENQVSLNVDKQELEKPVSSQQFLVKARLGVDEVVGVQKTAGTYPTPEDVLVVTSPDKDFNIRFSKTNTSEASVKDLRESADLIVDYSGNFQNTGLTLKHMAIGLTWKSAQNATKVTVIGTPVTLNFEKQAYGLDRRWNSQDWPKSKVSVLLGQPVNLSLLLTSAQKVTGDPPVIVHGKPPLALGGTPSLGNLQWDTDRAQVRANRWLDIRLVTQDLGSIASQNFKIGLEGIADSTQTIGLPEIEVYGYRIILQTPASSKPFSVDKNGEAYIPVRAVAVRVTDWTSPAIQSQDDPAFWAGDTFRAIRTGPIIGVKCPESIAHPPSVAFVNLVSSDTSTLDSLHSGNFAVKIKTDIKPSLLSAQNFLLQFEAVIPPDQASGPLGAVRIDKGFEVANFEIGMTKGVVITVAPTIPIVVQLAIVAGLITVLIIGSLVYYFIKNASAGVGPRAPVLLVEPLAESVEVAQAQGLEKPEFSTAPAEAPQSQPPASDNKPQASGDDEFKGLL